MANNIQQNDGLGEKSPRQRKASPKPKKDNREAPLASPGAFQEIVDLPAIQSPSPGQLEDEWREKIRNLENRLREQESLVAERDADLDATKADTADLAVLQMQLRHKDGLLREQEIAAEALEENVSARFQNLQEQLKAQDELLARREAELKSFRELLNAETEETRRKREARNRSSAESARLIEEQREARIALAKFEMEEWHIIGRRNAWKRAFRAVKRLFQKPRRNHEGETLKGETP